LSRFFPHYHLNNQTMSVGRRFISIVVLASLPFATNASFAYTFPYDPSAPSTLRTPPTGTGFGTAAKNQMFLTDIFEGYNIAGGFYTTPNTPWVNDQDVIVSDIPFVEGEVDWNSIVNTWVDNGVRYFTGNGVPNHPTGLFPIPSDQPAYPWYAALPDPGGEYPNASYLPIEEYDLYMAVPANPVYSDTPTAIGELTFAIATQTGATFHVNLALTNDDPNPYVDPIAGLPMDLCWGHPVHMQYHYHGYSWKCFPDQGNVNEHSPQFGIALDGFGVFGPRGDGGVLLTNDDLDVCHGHFGNIDWDGVPTDMYHYHLNNEFPYGPGCFRGTQIGVFSSNGEPSPPPSPASVPGPVPFLGALAALRWSRRLRNRCRPQATRPALP
jgi:hypothetical protein